MAINLVAPMWNIEDSYGRVASELASNFEKMGIHVNYFGGNAPRKVIQFSFGGIFMAYPSNMLKWPALTVAGKKISLSMFESDRLPNDWIEPLNTCDACITTSTWLVDVYRNSGVTTPVYVFPLGVSDAFTYKERAEKKKFRIIAIGDGGGRKGSHFALFAFVRAFGDAKDVELIIKSRREPAQPFSNKNIKLLYGDYTDEQMNELYQSCDMMVFPSCGEGFGLPPLEFAKTGGIVAATRWSGMADYIDEIGIGIDYSMTKAWMKNEKLKGIGHWANANIDQLSEAMIHVKNMTQAERNRRGKMASEYTNRYQWDTFARNVYGVWEDLHADTITARSIAI